MNQNTELLRDVVRSSRTGAQAITFMLEKTEDAPFREELVRQKQSYEDFKQQAEGQLSALSEHAEPTSMTQRMGMWMGMNMETLTDKSTPHLADLLVQGNVMGMIDMIRAQKASPEASPEAHELTGRFIDFTQQSIESTKPFL